MVSGETIAERISFLDEYEVEGILGGGRFSSVLKAKARKTGAEVAVKIVRKPTRQQQAFHHQSLAREDDDLVASPAAGTSMWGESSPNSSAIVHHRRDPNNLLHQQQQPSVAPSSLSSASSAFLPPPQSPLIGQSGHLQLPATRLKRIRTEYFVLLQQLREHHPLLVEVDRIGHTTNHLFFVMKRYELSLATLLRDPNSVRNITLSEDQARFVCMEVLAALEFLHYKGIVYRDLKPENILLGSDFHIALSDFDLSHAPAAHDDLQGEDAMSVLGGEPGSDIRRSSGPLSLSAATSLTTGPHQFHQTNALSGSSKLSSCSSGCRSGASDEKGAPSPTMHPETPLSSPQKVIKAQGKSVAASFSLTSQPNAPSPHQRSTSFVGTLEYLSPEVVRDAAVTPAIDFWCLGMLLYEMLFGFTAFRGNNERDVRFKQDEYFNSGTDAKLTFPLSPSVSDEAKDLLQKLLCPVQKYRATSSTIRDHIWIKKLSAVGARPNAISSLIRDVHRRRSPLATIASLTGDRSSASRGRDSTSAVSKSFERYMKKPPRPRPNSLLDDQQQTNTNEPSAASLIAIQQQKEADERLTAVKSLLQSEWIQSDCAGDGGLSFFVPVCAAEAPTTTTPTPITPLLKTHPTQQQQESDMEERFRHLYVSSTRLQLITTTDRVRSGSEDVGTNQPMSSQKQKKSFLSRLFSSSATKK